ncbi:YezD family protein [Bacillus alkalicola]|uniref:YezD family protein n=1 Tax=Evansella alkalicola TaxID=745819 RepID=UPI001FE69B2E|nr:YezD family protein [Bacillus alkalicola]
MNKNEAIYIEELKKLIEKIEYGSITITIHNNEITQIDATEKKRFDKPKNNN